MSSSGLTRLSLFTHLQEGDEIHSENETKKWIVEKVGVKFATCNLIGTKTIKKTDRIYMENSLNSLRKGLNDQTKYFPMRKTK
jgi:hypothetical protein